MPVEVLALGASLGRDAVERIAHIGADVVVPVLVEAEGAARVLDEQVQQADLVAAQLGQVVYDVVRHEVGAARARGEGELLLRPRHGCCSSGGIRWWGSGVAVVSYGWWRCATEEVGNRV